MHEYRKPRNGGNCVPEERGMMQQVVPEGQEGTR